MKRGGAVGLVGLGILLFLFGLLFVVGADGQGSRYAVGAASMAAAAVLAGLGIRLFRAADADSPEQVLADILKAAERRNGEVSEAEVLAALGKRAPLAPAVMAKVALAAGLAERREKDHVAYFVFKGLQPRLFVRRCKFCRAESSIASSADKCPRCGGAIATGVETNSASGDDYRMDG